MRELIKKDQIVTIIPHDFKDTNKGKVTDVSLEGFTMELKYIPRGLIKQNVCDFYSMTSNGYLYFESYIKEVNGNTVSIANPKKHRFLQRRKFTRIKFLEDLELQYEGITHKVQTLDLSAGGMKLRTKENINIEYAYKVCIKLNDEIEVNCKYQLIRVEKNNDGEYIISGQFTNLSNVDKMSLVQFCMKKSMETANK
ncbi:MAG: PilZ domain-containing protein [Cyanobacteria bacterium RUI128]|nr:PilZ domain-containing protein [Cyanobacteria bacterium RUI128]